MLLACDSGIRERLIFDEHGLEGDSQPSNDRAASWKMAAIFVPWLPPGEGRDKSVNGARFLLLFAMVLRGVDGDAMVFNYLLLIDDAIAKGTAIDEGG